MHQSSTLEQSQVKLFNPPTLAVTIKGINKVWKIQRSSIGVIGLISRAKPAKSAPNAERAFTVLACAAFPTMIRCKSLDFGKHQSGVTFDGIRTIIQHQCQNNGGLQIQK